MLIRNQKMLHLPRKQSIHSRVSLYPPFNFFALILTAKTQQLELRSAILSGDIAEVEKSLRNGADINVGIDAITPLTFAIQNGEEDIATYLIQAGVELSLKPLACVSEERKSRNNADVDYWLATLGLIFLWVDLLSWDRGCASILTTELWPSFLGPILNFVSAQTLFGFTMRGVIIELCSAFVWRNFNTALYQHARSVPTYTVMLIWAWTYNSPCPNFDSSGGLWWFFQHCLLVGKWWLLTVGILVVQDVLYFYIKSLRVLLQEARSDTRISCHGGSQALEAVLSYPGSSHKVASAIIHSGVLSREYVKSSIQPVMLSHDCEPLVLRLWTWALRNGHTEIVSSLLKLGMPPTQVHPRRNFSPIQCSAYFGRIGLVEQLLAAIDPTDPTAIEQVDEAFLASTIPDNTHRLDDRQEEQLQEQLQIQSMLLARVRDINARDEDGRTGLSYAVSGENLTLISQLLERGADVGLGDVRGRPPLSYLADGESCPSICNILTSAGADVNHQDREGNTIMLHHAALGNTGPLRELLKIGADPHRTNQWGETCLQLAARYCMTDMMQLLIDAGADVEASFLSTTPPLLQACEVRLGRSAGLRLLLENGADPNHLDSRGITPLHIVCRHYSYCENPNNLSDHLRSIEILIEHHANVKATYVEDKQDRNFNVSVIGVAAAHATDRVGALKALLAAGAPPNGLDEDGKPVIVTACNYRPRVDGESEKLDMVQLLLEAGADLHYQDELDRTLLHHASRPYSNNFLAIRTLLTRSLNVNSKDIYGRTALHNACQDEYWMTMDAYRTWVVAGMYSGSDEYASWHCSVESTLAIYTLLAHGADAVADDCFKCTPAHLAAKAGNPRVLAMLLLQAGSRLMYEYSDKSERLPFHYAVRSAEVVRLLLQYHSTGQISSNRYWSVKKQTENSLQAREHEFSNKIWHKILRSRYERAHPDEVVDDASHPLPWMKGRCNAQDKYGNTPLHYAALAGNVEVVKQYVALPDVDPTVRNNDGETPFDFSLENRDCALALRGRLQELGIQVSDTGSSNMLMVSKTKSRHAADRFVEALANEYEYGVYPLDPQPREKQQAALRHGRQSRIQDSIPTPEGDKALDDEASGKQQPASSSGIDA